MRIEIPSRIPDGLAETYVEECKIVLNMVLAYFEKVPSKAEVEIICADVADRLLMPSAEWH